MKGRAPALVCQADVWSGYHEPVLPGERRYRRAVRRAFARVAFYRDQWAAAGRVIGEPVPTPVAALPAPAWSLYPFAWPWSADLEPPPATLRPLAQALWLAGCRDRRPVLEVREALLDRRWLPRRGARRRATYRGLLSATAVVASPQRRVELNQAALAAAATAGAGWVVGGPAELAALPELSGGWLRPVHRLPVAAAGAGEPPDPAVPALLYEPALGYLGARVVECGQFHLCRGVYARVRAGALTLSLVRSRRPTLLDIVPPGATGLAVGRCQRHGRPVLTASP